MKDVIKINKMMKANINTDESESLIKFITFEKEKDNELCAEDDK